MEFVGTECTHYLPKAIWFPQVGRKNLTASDIPQIPSTDPHPDAGRHVIVLKKGWSPTKNTPTYCIRNVFYRTTGSKIYVENASELVAPYGRNIPQKRLDKDKEAISYLRKHNYIVMTEYQDRMCVELDWLCDNGLQIYECGIIELDHPMIDCKLNVAKSMIDKILNKKMPDCDHQKIFYNYSSNIDKTGKLSRRHFRTSFKIRKDNFRKKHSPSPTELMIRSTHESMGINTSFSYQRYLKLCKQYHMNEYEMKELMCLTDDVFYQFQSWGHFTKDPFPYLPRVYKLKMVELESFIAQKTTGVSKRLTAQDIIEVAKKTEMPNPFREYPTPKPFEKILKDRENDRLQNT